MRHRTQWELPYPKQILSWTIETKQEVEVNHVPNVRLHTYKDYMLEGRMRSPCRQCNSADYHEQTEFDSDPTHIRCHAVDCKDPKETLFFRQMECCAVMLWSVVDGDDDDVIMKHW